MADETQTPDDAQVESQPESGTWDEGKGAATPPPSSPEYVERSEPFGVEERLIAQREQHLKDSGLMEGPNPVGVVRGRSWSLSDSSIVNDPYLDALEKRAQESSSAEYPISIVRHDAPSMGHKDTVHAGRPGHPGEVHVHDPMTAEARADAEKNSGAVIEANTLPGTKGLPKVVPATVGGSPKGVPKTQADSAKVETPKVETPNVVAANDAT